MKCKKTFNEILVEADVLIEQTFECEQYEARMKSIKDLESLMDDAFSLSIDWMETVFVDQSNGGDFIIFRTNDERGICDHRFELNEENWMKLSATDYGTAFMVLSGIAFGF